MAEPASKPVAVITGAARRVGAEIARTLHAHHYDIVIHYNRSKSDAQRLSDELNSLRPNSASIFGADLNNSNAPHELANYVGDAKGRCDVLINNASTFYSTSLSDASLDDWENLFNSNAKAPYFLAQAFSPSLQKNHGCIINISDINAEKPRRGFSIYCMAKAANNMMTQTLSLELAPNIRVNGIAPGAILWPEDSDKQEIVTPEKLSSIPLKKLGGAEAIAKAVLFLVRDAEYATGEILTLDGGARFN